VLHEFPLTRVRENLTIKKPGEKPGHAGGVPSREVGPTTAAREGSLALGDEAEYSGGTAAELHGTSPLPLPAGCPNQFTRRGEGCQSSAEFCRFSLW
jgi:hypothetical protein